MEHEEDEISRVTRILMGGGSPDERAGLREELLRDPNLPRDHPERATTHPNLPRETRPYFRFKRVIDLAIAITLGVIFSPVILLIMLRILIADGRPFFVRVERPGQNGKSFRLLSFRKSYRNSYARAMAFVTAHPNYEVRRDGPFPYGVTHMSVTKYLDAFGLEYLPFFWNVLRAEMSIVGPTSFFFLIMQRGYWKDINLDISIINELRPGMISLTDAIASPDERYSDEPFIELYYLHKRSLLLDGKVMIAFVLMLIGMSARRRCAILGLPTIETIKGAIAKEEPTASEPDSHYVREYHHATTRAHTETRALSGIMNK